MYPLLVMVQMMCLIRSLAFDAFEVPDPEFQQDITRKKLVVKFASVSQVLCLWPLKIVVLAPPGLVTAYYPSVISWAFSIVRLNEKSLTRLSASSLFLDL